MVRISIVLLSLVILLTGCPETEQMLDPVISVEPKELAEIKEPEPEESQEEPAKEETPEEEVPEEEPAEEEVLEEPETKSLLTSEVGFFSDRELTVPSSLSSLN